MQYELIVSTFDLRVILLSMVDSAIVLSVKLDSGACLDNQRVMDYDYELDLVTLLAVDDKNEQELSLYIIASIEFESFYSYRGIKAKIFVIN